MTASREETRSVMASASGSYRTEVEVFGELADGSAVHRYTSPTTRA
jgi:hypothetical protein